MLAIFSVSQSTLKLSRLGNRADFEEQKSPSNLDENAN
jgi:hypothetical protein